MKTLAIKLDDELHAQLTMLGQILSVPVTTLMHQGVREHVTRLRNDPNVSGKARALVEAFEADVAVRRNALTSMFDHGKPEARKSEQPATPKAAPKADKATQA